MEMNEEYPNIKAFKEMQKERREINEDLFVRLTTDRIIENLFVKHGFDKGFQKGKLEEKKEELKFLKSLQGVLRTNKQSSMKLDNKIKQLQKELEEKGK